MPKRRIRAIKNKNKKDNNNNNNKRNASGSLDKNQSRKKLRRSNVNTLQTPPRNSSGSTVTQFDLALARLSSNNPNPKSAGPYKSSHDILLVGEGNLSFAVALASALGGKKIVATTFDTLHEFKVKYPSTGMGNKSLLENLGCKVYHGVDASKLEEQEWLFNSSSTEKICRQFHRVVFNFPHTGHGTKPLPALGKRKRRRENHTKKFNKKNFNKENKNKEEEEEEEDKEDKEDKEEDDNDNDDDNNEEEKVEKKEDEEEEKEDISIVESNQQLLRNFFSSAAHFVLPIIGEIHVTLRTDGFYKVWHIKDMATQSGLRLKSTVPFVEKDYPGYKNSRTAGEIFMRDAPSTSSALIYAFSVEKKPSFPSLSTSLSSSSPTSLSLSSSSSPPSSPTPIKQQQKKIKKKLASSSSTLSASAKRRLRRKRNQKSTSSPTSSINNK